MKALGSQACVADAAGIAGIAGWLGVNEEELQELCPPMNATVALTGAGWTHNALRWRWFSRSLEPQLSRHLRSLAHVVALAADLLDALETNRHTSSLQCCPVLSTARARRHVICDA